MDPEGPDLRKLRQLSEHAKSPRLERAPNFGRIGAFLAAAAVVLVVPWFVFTRLGDAGPAKPRAHHVATHSASPSPSPSRAPLPSTAGHYQVLTGVTCARIRLEAGSHKQVLNCVQPGVVLWSDGKLTTVEGEAWVHVVDPYRRIDGWIATRYVQKVP